MRFAAMMVAAGVALAAVPSMAQTTAPAKPMHRVVPHTGRPGHPTATDKGPFTNDADKAYNGGGVILESAPGGAPPPPSAAVNLPPNSPLQTMAR